MLRAIERVVILACGTSWHAGWWEVPDRRTGARAVEVDYSSEFRYRHPIIDAKTLAIVITQSGETAGHARRAARSEAAGRAIDCDLQRRRQHGHARGRRHVYTHAGPRLAWRRPRRSPVSWSRCICWPCHRQARGRCDPDARKRDRGLEQLPVAIEHALEVERRDQGAVSDAAHHRDFLYLGRGINYPIALEGALKLKEISTSTPRVPGRRDEARADRVHRRRPAGGGAGGRDEVFEKALGNIQEAKARGARMIVVTNASQANVFDGCSDPSRDVVLTVPDAHPCCCRS
jgi:glucosamine--fructose-6-phosphate aminotransferase (isomerizing)